MQTKKISLGEMWRSEASGEVFIVTSFCKELFSSYACLRSVEPRKSPKALEKSSCSRLTRERR